MSVSPEWSQAECSREATSATSSSRRPSISFVLFFLICNSYSTSVQPSVSIPIADRPSGGAQVRSPSCREWRVANVLHRVGQLMFNSDCRALFSQPVIQLFSAQVTVGSTLGSWGEWGLLQGGVPLCPELCLGEKSNLLYETDWQDGANNPERLTAWKC